MRFLAALVLLATVVSCAGPVPEPSGEAAVVEPGVVCRVGNNGSPILADRGIGGTGTPAKAQVSERGIGGTGVVGVVTGFASICVAGLEVRFDKAVPVTINGLPATAGQLRVGQVVAIKAAGSVTMPDPLTRARTISVRFEVSGPIETVESGAGVMMVAGQRVIILPTTWVAGRFGVGSWITVSGLRQSDGTIIASRLDRARVGALTVRGQISRERETTRIGNLVLHDSAVGTVKTGTFVSIAGRYRNGAADVTSIDADLLAEDPAGYFGISTARLIVQAFVHVEGGMVWLINGQKFQAGPGVQGTGGGYRNAIIWLERTADGVFTATALHNTSYRAQPKDAPSRSGGHGAGELVLPPDAPPGPRPDDPLEGEGGTVPLSAPGEAPTSNAIPSQAEPSADGAFIADQRPTLPPGVTPTVKLATRD
ncbi:MAG TPA: hypothetical protein DDZ81_01525 [Acetobacteraceae bacterium]|jgi:hypothetical protein|nr:hypothetical protein [Acetobacteraceae bacterium]